MEQVNKAYTLPQTDLHNVQAIFELIEALETLQDTDIGDYRTAKIILDTRPDLADQFKLILNKESLNV